MLKKNIRELNIAFTNIFPYHCEFASTIAHLTHAFIFVVVFNACIYTNIPAMLLEIASEKIFGDVRSGLV